MTNTYKSMIFDLSLVVGLLFFSGCLKTCWIIRIPEKLTFTHLFFHIDKRLRKWGKYTPQAQKPHTDKDTDTHTKGKKENKWKRNLISHVCQWHKLFGVVVGKLNISQKRQHFKSVALCTDIFAWNQWDLNTFLQY